MKTEKTGLTENASLRQKAEEIISNRPPAKTVKLTEADTLKLMHELEVRQLELEMQSDMLQHAMENATLAVHRYENDTVGYFTLTRDGTIGELNPSGAGLLGKERTDLLNSIFRHAIASGSLPVFDGFFRKIFETGTRQTCEVRLIADHNTSSYLYLEGIVATDKRTCLVLALDISERKSVEEALQVSEFFFRESQRAAFIGSYETDFISGFWKSSEVLDQIFGIDQNYLRSVAGWLDITHPQDREMMDHYLQEEVIAKKMPFHKEYRIIRKSDGQTRWVMGLGKADYDTAGNIISLIGTIQDVTERRRAEEALVLREKEFRMLAESMPQIVWITRADGWNIYFNQRWIDYTGLSLEESYGAGWNKPFHPDDRQYAWDAWETAVKEQGAYSMECRLQRKDGTYRWWLIRGVPITDEQGTILKWFGTCTDIEDIKKSAEKLNTSEIKYRLLFEAAKDGILILDAESGQIVDANPCLMEMLGYSHTELLGKELWEIGVFKNIAASKEAFWELQKIDYIRFEDMPMETKAGKLIDVEFIINIYAVGKQKVFQCNIRDITERKQGELELLKLKNELEIKVAEKTKELKERVDELERFHDATIDRELRMKELRDEIETLKKNQNIAII